VLSDDHVWVVVLAGGIGSRFWPVSTPERPKQLLPLASQRPLIVDTIERARALVPDERIRVLAGEHLARPFATALTDLAGDSYWIEPRARGTAPVLTWAADRLARMDGEAVMVSLHADHLIRPLDAFRDSVAAAVSVARHENALVCIGAVPDRIETGYGHIEPGDALNTPDGVQGYRVRAFHEKPDRDTARSYVERGYLWNTGIFVWKASVLLEEIAQHAPEVSAHTHLLKKNPDSFFDVVPVSVIDRAVMERSERVATVRATFTWDDVGSWEALARTRAADENGNVAVGASRAVDSRDNVVFSENGEVVLFGVDDLVVVRTADTTLVLPRGRAADLKTLLNQLGLTT
jgi:mannose-1-phosphate guanylyltransferase